MTPAAISPLRTVTGTKVAALALVVLAILSTITLHPRYINPVAKFKAWPLSSSSSTLTASLTPTSPYGPVALRYDYWFFPIQHVDGKKVTLLSRYSWADGNIWPLENNGTLWCKGDGDLTWSQAKLRNDNPCTERLSTSLECEASGKTLELELRDNSGVKTMTIPMTSTRRQNVPPNHKPTLVAWTMFRGWSELFPAWVEHLLMHGVEEIYIYDNEDNQDTSILQEQLAVYIEAGLVIHVPWYRGIVANWVSHDWPLGQIMSMNHAIRSLEGYAEWVLMCDEDELPMFRDQPFSYIDFLNEATKSQPDLGVLTIRNCFTGGDEWAQPFASSIGEIATIPPSVLRWKECQPAGARSKMFIRPNLVDAVSVHIPTANRGSKMTSDPEEGMWLMHLSGHPDWTGASPQMPIDLSYTSGEIERRLEARFGLESAALEDEY